MKNRLLLLFFLFTGILNAQPFEIPVENQPFYQLLEWKGVGGLLLSRDPSFNQQQIKITLIAGEGKSTWQQVFNPIDKEVQYIAEDGGKYVYFLENLELKSGKIFFHQISVAGNVKSTNTLFTPALKKLGDYDLDALNLVDIVTTDKALVYLFSYTDKAKDKLSTIAVSMTHHNFLCYATLIAENVTSSSKVEDQISWYIAGESGENLVYAARTHAGKDAGWKLKEVDPKGKIVREFSMSSTGTKFTEHSRVGFGRRGSTLLKRVEPKEKGTLVVANGNYYIAGVEVEGTTASLVSYIWKDAKWTKATTSPIAAYNAKKEFQVGYFQLKEGIGYFVKHVQSEGHFHPFDNEHGIVSGNVDQQINNPSRLLTAEYPSNFVASLPGKWLVFDLKQLPSKAAVKCEYKQR